MRNIRRIFWALMLVVLLFFAINFNWTHAFLASLTANTPCPAHLVAQAKKDVAHLFGSSNASPLWVCATKPLLGLDISHGSTRFAPFLPSIIIVGRKGMKRNVMAHEYAHAEMSNRTSALLRTYLIPTWFDEGLAMQVDHRRAYSRRALARYLRTKGLQKPKLDRLGWSHEFFAVGLQGRLHYAFSSCVVKLWLKADAKGQLQELINNIGWLNPFPYEQFRKFEQLCLKK